MKIIMCTCFFDFMANKIVLKTDIWLLLATLKGKQIYSLHMKDCKFDKPVALADIQLKNVNTINDMEYG